MEERHWAEAHSKWVLCSIYIADERKKSRLEQIEVQDKGSIAITLSTLVLDLLTSPLALLSTRRLT
jgi:hypothetical protein